MYGIFVDIFVDSFTYLNYLNNQIFFFSPLNGKLFATKINN